MPIDRSTQSFQFTALDVKPVVTSSGLLTASQNFSLTCTVDVPQSLNATVTYIWTRGTQVGADSVLSFNPLLLSNSGQYVCTVTVTSDLLDSPLTDDSDAFEVTVLGESLQ